MHYQLPLHQCFQLHMQNVSETYVEVHSTAQKSAHSHYFRGNTSPKSNESGFLANTAQRPLGVLLQALCQGTPQTAQSSLQVTYLEGSSQSSIIRSRVVDHTLHHK